MEEDQDLKFVCKVCNKKYPCGKSLGGHMRSHVLDNSTEFEEKVEDKLEKLEYWSSDEKNSNREKASLVDAGFEEGPHHDGENDHQSKFELGGHTSYGLRENPKKTWRAVDSTSLLPQERMCQQCGKVFQSLKALCGHMACHSEKDKGALIDSNSDSEAEEEELRLRTRSKTKRYKTIVVKPSSFCLVNSSTVNNSSSSVSEIDEQEQEEVAKSLMKLSRDSRIWNCVTSVDESSDNNSVVLETKSSSTDMRFGRKDSLKRVYNQDETPPTKNKEDRNLKLSVSDAEAQSESSDSAYFLEENAIVESDVSVDGFGINGNSKWITSKMSNAAWCDESRTHKEKGLNRNKRNTIDSSKDITEECEDDDYWLSSYEDKCEPRKRLRDSSYHPELGNESYKKMKLSHKGSEGCKKIHNKKKYECLNCKKIFGSYQALGGHRPCHKKANSYVESINGTGENSLDADHDGKPFSAVKEPSYNPEKKIKPKKVKGHECPYCDRVFKSGQALGGHKRSHFIGGSFRNLNQSSAAKKEADDLLDLNLPAPIDDEDNEHAHFVSW
uniref:ZPT4-3 n=1 Tax=Petunia hybrida TaxID=4102 RepID=P93719_PETHY|nr:ZPT4-3 [Petunia x hybrida]